RTTGQTTPPTKTPHNPNATREVNERNANTGRAVQTPPQSASNTNRTVQKVTPTDNNERQQTVHRAPPPPQSVQKAPPVSQQERVIQQQERKTSTPPTSQQRTIESHQQPQREYTPRTQPVDKTPSQPREMQQRPPQR